MLFNSFTYVLFLPLVFLLYWSITGAPYYDYSCDPLFVERYDLFSDCDHLNLEGARVFTDLLVERVANDLLKQSHSSDTVELN